MALIGLISILGYFIYIQKDQSEIDQVVRSNFKNIYPNYTLINHNTVDGDFVARYIEVTFNKPNDDQPHTETWLYLDTEQGWKFNKKLDHK
jgi:hypothetical protein